MAIVSDAMSIAYHSHLTRNITMQTMHVIHITKHSLRHMPTFTHAVGTLEEVTKELLGAASKEKFEYAHALIAYAAKVNKDKDYQLVHAYDVY